MYRIATFVLLIVLIASYSSMEKKQRLLQDRMDDLQDRIDDLEYAVRAQKWLTDDLYHSMQFPQECHVKTNTYPVRTDTVVLCD